MRRGLLSLALFLTMLVGCEEDNTVSNVITDPALAAELKASPEELRLADRNLKLTAFVWRDLMPGVEPKGLYCSAKLTDRDSLPLSGEFTVSRVFVIKGSDIWVVHKPEVRTVQDLEIEAFANNGPFWETSIEADVVLEFKRAGITYIIKAPPQKISATY